MDYVGIDIKKIELASSVDADYQRVQYFVHTDLNKNLGNALEMSLPKSCDVGSSFFIKITYNTNEKSMAINWLKPSQTAGKKLPYLFTQCESIACRSIAPMMDSPAIKITFDAQVTVKSEFVVKMSANETKVELSPDKTQKTYFFKNQIKMPSYLIAIAVGDLEYRSLGERVGVISEPSQIDMVANELESL
jgi:leukotriene-A4 hydrolase